VEIKLGLHLLYMKILLLFILCFVGLYKDAQIPTNYIGTWEFVVAGTVNKTASLVLDADGTYAYNYYNPYTTFNATTNGTYTFNTSEVVFNKSCGGHSYRATIIEVSTKPLQIKLTDLDWGMYDTSIGCFAGNMVLQKKE